MQLDIYTDGSYRSDKALGGYGYLFFDVIEQKVIKKSVALLNDSDPSRNPARMEIMAMIYAYHGLFQLMQITKKTISGTIYSDSEFLVKAITEGTMEEWKAHNWKNSKHKKVVNADLLLRLDRLRYAPALESVIFSIRSIKSKQGFNKEVDQAIREAMAYRLNSENNTQKDETNFE
jgi:ribonuclease HI